eukprot:4062420-Pleurochrysis_carterae.AAC.1
MQTGAACRAASAPPRQRSYARYHRKKSDIAIRSLSEKARRILCGRHHYGAPLRSWRYESLR